MAEWAVAVWVVAWAAEWAAACNAPGGLTLIALRLLYSTQRRQMAPLLIQEQPCVPSESICKRYVRHCHHSLSQRQDT